MTLEFHSYVNSEFLYTFSVVPSIIRLLVDVQNFLRHLYIFRFKLSLYGNILFTIWTWFALSSDFPYGNYIV